MDFTIEYDNDRPNIDIIILKSDYDELIKIKIKYEALINQSIQILSNNNIYCRLCNTLSKSDVKIRKHIFIENL